jgi:hypothetical protein
MEVNQNIIKINGKLANIFARSPDSPGDACLPHLIQRLDTTKPKTEMPVLSGSVPATPNAPTKMLLGVKNNSVIFARSSDIASTSTKGAFGPARAKSSSNLPPAARGY